MTVLEHTSLIQASRQSRYRMRGSISQMFAERLMRRPRPTVARRSRLRYHTWHDIVTASISCRVRSLRVATERRLPTPGDNPIFTIPIPCPRTFQSGSRFYRSPLAKPA